MDTGKMSSIGEGPPVFVSSAGKALGLSLEKNSLKLAARTVPAVALSLPVGERFEVRILHVEDLEGFVYARPTSVDSLVPKFLLAKFEALRYGQLETPEVLSHDEVYLVTAGNGYRAVLTRPISTSKHSVYDIDFGHSTVVPAGNICKLPAPLREFPPLAFRALYPFDSPPNFSSPTVFVEIGGDYLSSPVKSLQEGYPPSVVCEFFLTKEQPRTAVCEEQSNTANSERLIAEALQTRVDPLSYSLPVAGEQKLCGRGLFPPFEAAFPCRLNARVTMRISRDVYLMRNTTALTALYNQMVRPTTNLLFSGIGDVALDIACIVHVKRPLNRNVARVGRCRFYRGLLRSYEKESGACEVFLVDYSEVTRCDKLAVFDLSRQPSAVLTTPAAAFRLCVERVTPARPNGIKNVKLEDDEEYSVCLTSKNDDGLFVGSVAVPLEVGDERSKKEKEARDSGRRRLPSSKTDGLGRRADENELETQRLADQLKDARKKLNDERKLFEKLKEARIEEIATMAMQLQMVNINRSAEHIADTTARTQLGYGGASLPRVLGSDYGGTVGWNREMPAGHAHRSVGRPSSPTYEATCIDSVRSAHHSNVHFDNFSMMRM